MKSLSKREKKGRFICLTGIDGSGKTTVARFLARSLAGGGSEWRYVYCRLKPFLLRPLITLGHRMFLREVSPAAYAGYAAAKKSLGGRSLFASFYQWVLIADYYLQVVVKIRVPLVMGRNIVCDRYIFDTLATDLAIDFSYSNGRLEKMLALFARLFPCPDVTFLLDVPAETAFRRKRDVPDIEYLRERRAVYGRIARLQRIIVVDGSEELNVVKNVVLASALEAI